MVTYNVSLRLLYTRGNPRDSESKRRATVKIFETLEAAYKK